MGMNLDQATEVYLKLRARKAEIKKRHSDELAPITEKMEKIENAILNHFQKSGQKSARTAHGTPYISERTSVTVQDRETFLGFVMAEGGTQFLENKAAKTAVMEFIKEHGEPPPGVKVTSELKVNVRS